MADPPDQIPPNNPPFSLHHSKKIESQHISRLVMIDDQKAKFAGRSARVCLLISLVASSHGDVTAFLSMRTEES